MTVFQCCAATARRTRCLRKTEDADGKFCAVHDPARQCAFIGNYASARPRKALRCRRTAPPDNPFCGAHRYPRPARPTPGAVPFTKESPTFQVCEAGDVEEIPSSFPPQKA